MQSFERPWEDEELIIFRESVQKFMTIEVAPNDRKWREQKHVDKELWTKAGEMGLLLTDIPEAHGGMGCDFRYEAVVLEEMARIAHSGWNTAVHSIVAQSINAHGTEGQKQKYLPKMARGELIGAIALTEPGAGSDLQNIKMRAERDGDGYALNGSKLFISNGYSAGLIAVACKTEPNVGGKGISMFLVETQDLEGFRVGRVLEKIGMHAQDTAELFFDGVHVHHENLLGGTEGQGFYQLMGDLAYERTQIAVMAAAGMEGALNTTIEYTKQREAFGQPVFDFQNTRFKLAEIKTVCHIARLFADDCVEKLISGKLDSVTASMAKYWLTEKHCEVLDQCLQLHGGSGYMTEYEIARRYVDARVTPIFGGTNEIMREIIARSL